MSAAALGEGEPPQQAPPATSSPALSTEEGEASIRMDAAGGEAAGDRDNGSGGGALAQDHEEEGEWQTVGEKKRLPKPPQTPPPSSSSSSSNRSSEAAAAAAPAGGAQPPPPPQQQQRQQEDEEDSEDDNDDSDDENGPGFEMELGFAEPLEPGDAKRLLFLDPDWDEWDGGKIGGKPIWLNPRELPPRAALDCASCGEPLAFILQIYCPLDDPPGAFHRALYVFCCRKPRCTGPGCAKVFRCQLPQENAFYAHDSKAKASTRAALAAKTCDVCGQGADKSCAGCKRAGYCSRTHQKEAWRAGHKLVCSGAAAVLAAAEAGGEEAAGVGGMGHMGGQLRSVLPEYEIVIEAESGAEAGKGGGEGQSAEERRREDEALLAKYQDVYVSDASAAAADDDARVGQRELDAAVGANPALKDRQSLRFLAVIGKEPDQVLRYARWQDRAPLWVATAGQPARGGLRDDISPCAHCGAPRAFEFQVMPQLLHYLRVDADAQMPGGRPGEAVRLAAMDWGTLAAYTCTKSCDVPEVGYVEEVLWRQEPMA